MKTHSDSADKTSRRKFKKSVASSLASAQGSQDRGKQGPGQQPGTQKDKVQIFTEHDTPPPILIYSGSLMVELDNAEFNTTTTIGGRKKHRRNPSSSAYDRVEIEHIKVFDGSGESLYRNLNAEGCEITFLLDEPSAVVDVVVRGGPFLEIDTLSDRALVKAQGTDKPSGNSRRKARFRHKKGNDEATMKSLKVTKGSETLFNVSLSDLPGPGDIDKEVRVMIWLHERRI